MRNTMKKLGMLFAVAVMTMLFAVSVGAKEIVDSGECGAQGEDVTWVLYDDGVDVELVISGNGKIDVLAFESLKGIHIDKVVIEEGVTSIGAHAFLSQSLSSVVIPDSVTNIGMYAFANCKNLKEVFLSSNVTSIGNDPFSSCTKLTAINVDDNNNYFCDIDGVLFSKDMKKLIQYPAGNKNISYEIPDSVEIICEGAFADCNYLTSVTIGDSVLTIGEGAFIRCENLTEIYIPDQVEAIDSYVFLDCINLTDVLIGDSVTYIGREAFLGCSKLSNVVMSDSVEIIVLDAFYGCDNIENVYYQGTEEQWKTITIEKDGNASLTNSTIHFLGDIYNLGEETYSFENYCDKDSKGGHCFGMSVTSSGYHLGCLNPADVGANSSREIYNLSETDVVKEPICNYQAIQGSIRDASMVAGGTNYRTPNKYDIKSDWKEVVNYVKNHDYDYKGNLQIGFRKEGEGGHAINFIRYEEVNGQPRIYAYDNNAPSVETYFYQNEKGEVLQAPYSTFSGSIDCIALRNVSTYFTILKGIDIFIAINKPLIFYAFDNSISIEGAYESMMDGITEKHLQYMYELPEKTTTVIITPLVDNATFTYMDKEYSFGEIDEDTYAEFTLSTSEEDAPEFEIINAPEVESETPDEPQQETENDLIKKLFNLIKLLIDFILGLLRK